MKILPLAVVVPCQPPPALHFDLPPDLLRMPSSVRPRIDNAATLCYYNYVCTLQETKNAESYVQPPEEGLPGENLWYASACC
jgi:hypothetical protein